MQQERKLLGLLEAQAEEIRKLKGLLYAQGEELIELKNMIKSMAKDVSSTKDISKKAESITSYLALLYTSNRQAPSKVSFSTIPPLSTPKSVAKGP